MGSVAQRHVEVPVIQPVDEIVQVPVHKHRHVPMVSVTQKHVEVPVIQTVEKIVDVPVVKQIDVPHITTIEKIVEVPHVQVVEKVEEVPMVGQTLPGAQRHTQVALPPVRQQGPAEEVTVMEIGPAYEPIHGGTH